jgi:RNA polymerase sigma factor (sigma-70 family)
MSPSISARLLLTQSDARLVAFARAGHERAFEALVRRYRGPLLGYCRRLLLSEERAEDALQQALMQAWLALRAGTEVENVKGWLYRIVHNAALNALRVSGYDYCTLSESLSGADAPQEDLDRRIAVREALAGLAALPEMQREALLRTAVEGSSHRQTARELGLSETAVRGLVYRARAALRATAGAIVPPPLVSWALGSGGGGAPVGERLAEVGAGGGSAGMAGLLMKGGAMAVTAGVLAGGITAAHVHLRHVGKHPRSESARRDARVKTTQVELAASRVTNVTPPVVDVRKAPESARSRSSERPLRVVRVRRRRRGASVPAGTAPATGPAPPSSGVNHDRSGARDGSGVGGGGGGSSGVGGSEGNEPRSAVATAPGSGTDANGGEGGHDVGLGGPSGGGSGGSGERGSAGDGASGGSSTGSGRDGSGDRGGGQGEQPADGSRLGEASESQGAGTSTRTSAGGSSKAAQSVEGKGD